MSGKDTYAISTDMTQSEEVPGELLDAEPLKQNTEMQEWTPVAAE